MKMRLENARDNEQRRRMKCLQEQGLCYFCRQGNEKDKTLPKAIHETEYWYVSKNDFPLEGSVHHYLMVSKRHVTRETELTVPEWTDLLNIMRWMEAFANTSGFSKFSRNGNLAYTGATLDHLHIHFLVGIEGGGTAEKIKVTLGYKK